MSDKLLRVRAHHGMCLAFFQGKGYSGEFTRHMGQVQERLRENSSVVLLAEADLICARCPNLLEGVCRTVDKVAAYDGRVLELCGLHSGEVLPWERFSRLVRDRILLPGRREEICGDCQWTELCGAPPPAPPKG